MIAALPIVGSVLGSAMSGVASGVAPLIGAQAPVATAAATGAGGDFGQMIAQFSSDTVENLKKSEATSIQGLQGKTGIQSVVESVMSAQESLQTALAVRDKAVAAFQEISRMAI